MYICMCISLHHTKQNQTKQNKTKTNTNICETKQNNGLVYVPCSLLLLSYYCFYFVYIIPNLMVTATKRQEKFAPSKWILGRS